MQLELPGTHEGAEREGAEGLSAPAAFDHVWYWHPRMGEKNRKGLRARVLVRGARNSIRVELEDGETVITSRYDDGPFFMWFTPAISSSEARSFSDYTAVDAP